jgi:hypothetical protein
MTRVANPDRVRLTVLYLRLWKLCDSEFYHDRKYDSAKHYDLMSVDPISLRSELHEVMKQKPDWVTSQVLSDIRDTLDLLDGVPRDRSAMERATLDTLRRTFQQKAFDLAGEIKLASEAER